MGPNTLELLPKADLPLIHALDIQCETYAHPAGYANTGDTILGEEMHCRRTFGEERFEEK